MEQVTLREFVPGDRDWVVAQHALLYARDEGFDASFGPFVAQILGGFIAERDPSVERGWIAQGPQGRVGCIFCVRLDGQTAKIRMFLLLPAARGMGLGRRLLEAAMDHARAAGFSRMQLWTHESHRAAGALYRKTGWALVGSTPVQSFGKPNVEQVWTITL